MKTIPELKKEFMKHIEQLSYSRHTWQVWQDFNALAAISLQQSTRYTAEREEQYLTIIGKYNQKEINTFPKMIAIVIAALELQFCDFLGEVFMDLELGNKWKGQFFTPYDICKMMAQLTIPTFEMFDNGNVVTVSEPACGGGAMLIALCEHLRENDINYQRQVRITAVDVDMTSFHMAYIQLSLIGCNAVVVHGNTLSVEEFEAFRTPLFDIHPIALGAPSAPLEVELPSQRTLMEFS